MSTAKDEAEQARREMEAKATPATADTEGKLIALDAMMARRRKDPDLEAAYEALRADLVAQLKAEGPRYFLNADGLKQYAFAVQPEPLDVDVDALIKMYEEGGLSLETLDKVAPRRADREAFRREVAKGNITQAQLLASTKLRQGTPHVKISPPVDAE